MEDPIPPAVSPSRKRSLDEVTDGPPSTPIKAQPQSAMSSALSSPMSLPPAEDTNLNSSAQGERHGSPAPSTSTSLSTEAKSHPGITVTLNVSTQPAAKRRKLTPEEKLQKEHEKLQKAQEREAKKALKEAEELQKAEERRRKAEEKEEKKRAKDLENQQKEKEKDEKKRVKDLEKQQKDLEKQQKEEAILKKEKAQLRLGNFFSGVKVPPAPLNLSKHQIIAPSPEKHAYMTKERAQRNSMSVEPYESQPSTPTKIKNEPDLPIPEYRKIFLPFELPSHTVLAPNPAAVNKTHESQSEDGAQTEINYLAQLAKPFANVRGRSYPSVQGLIDKMHGGSSASMVDLTGEKTTFQACVEALHEVPIKYLHFDDDERPAYCGTRTKYVPPSVARSLAVNPFTPAIDFLRYEEDSEAEWDGEEDLTSEGDEDLESDEEEGEFADFVDDESHAVPLRRAGALKELEVKSTGLCWQQPGGTSKVADDGDEVIDLDAAQLELLLADPSIQTINPFSTEYWQKASSKKPAPPLPQGQTRLPLAPTTTATANKQNILTSFVAAKAETPKPAPKAAAPKRFVDSKDLDSFKNAVAGRSETKAALVPILHQQFKNYPKDVIAATLSYVASRNTVHKQWFLLDMPTTLPQPTPTV